MSIEIWKLTASLPCASSSGASSRLISQRIRGGSRWPGKCRSTPSKALAWMNAHQLRTFATAVRLAGGCGDDGEVSIALLNGCVCGEVWIQEIPAVEAGLSSDPL